MILRGRVSGVAGGAVTVTMDGALAGCAVAGRAAPDAALAPGAKAHVAIRPEDIEVVAADGTRAEGNALTGVIEALLFVGDRYEARVALGGEQRILMLLPRTPEWREGQRLRLGLPPETVSVWPG